ncbi:MAG TPA: DNA polymerase I [Gemmatimonadaceae bacterium]|nr:DNA polymerase I [Gemmatimonadaceae bacterium]
MDISPPPSPRLFLIDGYALIYRAFFALISRPLTTSRGENTSAAWGIVNFLQRLIEQHKPEYLGWVLDSGLSFRHERYPAYKATREKLGDELQADFDRGMERIGELLSAYNVPVLSMEGFEADDVIGTLARRGAEQGVNVVVVSGDKDFYQLIAPNIYLLNPGRGGPASVDEKWVGVENASERLGVSPEHVTDYLALVGDSSDNVPGVRGIGDKTACELVDTYGPLEEILAHVDEIKKKRPREALKEHEADARLSKELVTLRYDLPIELDLDELAVREPDHARLKEIFVELEFHSLARDHAVEEPKKKEEAVKYTTVDTIQALEKMVKRARSVPHIAVDTETIIDPGSPQLVDPLRCTIVSISIAVAPGEAYYLPLRHRAQLAEQGDLLVDVAGDRSPTDAPEDRGLVMGGDEVNVEKTLRDAKAAKSAKSSKKKSAKSSAEPASIAARMLANGGEPVKNLPPLDSPEMEPLRALLEDPSVKKTGQNAKYDLLVLRRSGVNLRGLDFDTMIASYVLDPGRRSHGLDVLALEFLDHKMISFDELCGKGRSMIPFDETPISAARDYSCEDADMTLRLRAIFEPQLEVYALTSLFREIEIPLVDVLADMEWEGISIDTAFFASLKERFASERQRVERRIHEEAGVEFNINSNPQLRHILFEKLQLPVIKKTATGPSTDASVLQELAEQGHTIPELLMEYRELSKLESTYLDALPALVHPETHRIHTSFNQTVATTGRLSSSDPNLQNIPIRTELGRDIRRGFVPRKGWMLVAADYSQIELRLLAHLSNDPAFVQAFRAGGDIHRQTASIIFDVPLEEVTPEMRARAKTINFATIYGQGPRALSQQLRIEFAEAKRFIEEYFERFSGIRGYLDSMVEFAREHGYVQTIFGRRRYIPELKDRNFNIRQFGERTATNSPIQGSAADLIKIAMIRIHKLLAERQVKSRMLLQVHDELVFEVPPEELEAITKLVKFEMENAAQLSVPLVVELGAGENWLATKH